jgi:uncharacterized protein YndB with AHSA1/START domain
MTQTKLLAPVWKSVEVACSLGQAFNVLTQEPTRWWPQSHRITVEREAIVFEPFVGGRWYERAADGTERDWGRVLVWEPNRQIKMSWLVGDGFTSIDDDELASRIRIVFAPLEPERTLVSIGHVDLHRHGDLGAKIRGILDGPSPGETLECFAGAIDSTRAAQR